MRGNVLCKLRFYAPHSYTLSTSNYDAADTFIHSYIGIRRIV